MKAIYPGTFDPITLGHVDLVARAAACFDEIIIVVTQNSAKQSQFSLAQRKQFVEASIQLKNCRVIAYEGLLVECMRQNNINILLRGIRTATDYQYELQLFHANKLLYPEMEVVFYPASSDYQYLSSTLVREVIKYGGEIHKFVPKAVIDGLTA